MRRVTSSFLMALNLCCPHARLLLRDGTLHDHWNQGDPVDYSSAYTAGDHVLQRTLLDLLLGRVATMLELSAAEVGGWDSGLTAGQSFVALDAHLRGDNEFSSFTRLLFFGGHHI